VERSEAMQGRQRRRDQGATDHTSVQSSVAVASGALALLGK
jgi:hypothetical protein